MKIFFTRVLPVVLAVFGTTAWAAQDLEIVTEEHWTSSSLEQKRAYLFGIKCHWPNEFDPTVGPNSFGQ